MLIVRLLQRLHRGNAKGVVDKYVDASEGFGGTFDKVGDAGLIGDIRGHRKGLAPRRGDLFGHLVEARLGACREDDIGTGRGELGGQCAAQPRADTGHHDNLAVKIEETHQPNILVPMAVWRSAMRLRQPSVLILFSA
ncbi:Uncharacterised protein [Mycobacteroides abscessus subsp. massiliense]|nr:Uncharacterised protein [Mycobacteroides abscessus subsp. massiliense]